MITTAFVTFVVYKNMDNVKEIVNIEDQNDLWLHIWDLLVIDWKLTADGDFVKYTHRLTTTDYGILWAKSTSINLNNYQWKVKVKAIVDGIHADVYIIDISSIESLDPVMVETWTEIVAEDEKWKYLADAGLYFSKIFLLNYKTDDSENNSNKIILKNTNTDNEITIEYFSCTKDDMNKNCKQLSKDYWANAWKSITTSAGITFYRLAESNKRYFTNENRRWYRIIWVDEQELASLAEMLQFVNENYFKENILSNISKLCLDEQNKINEVEKYDLSLQWNNLIVSIQWKTFDSKAECILRINPELQLKAEKLSFDIIADEDKTEENTEDIEDNEDTDAEDIENTDEISWDPDVEQFPINLEKWISFTSSRWYTINFPAGNISRRAGTAEDRTLWQAGVNCRATLDIDKYEKDRWDTIENPKIKIHECTIKNDFQTSEKYRHIVVQDDRNFIIEVLDPAWVKFTDNISVE